MSDALRLAAGAPPSLAFMVIAGVAVFAAGLVAIVVIVVSFLLGSDNAPLPLTVIALLMPVGLGLGLLGLLRRTRR